MENQNFFSLLIANLPGLVYRCKNDPHWTMTFINEGCKKLTGYHPHELLHNKVMSYGKLILPKHQQRVQKQITQALAKKVPYTIEYQIQTKDQEEKWVWEQGQGIFDESGKLICLQGFITDITEKKIINQRLKEENSWLSALFENASDPIVRLDKNHRVLEINKPFAEKFKFSLEEIKGAELDEVLNSTGVQVADPRITEKLFQGKKVETEGTRYSKDGRPIECIIKGIPIMVDNQRLGSYAIYIDITEQKKREQELKDKNQRLQESYAELTAYSEEITAMNEELDETIKEINNLNERFIKMINVVSNLDKSTLDQDNRFLSELLKAAINIVPEADYGGIYMVDKEGQWTFVDTVGHDINLLKKVHLNKEVLHHNLDQGIYTAKGYSLDVKKLSPEEKVIFQKALKPVAHSIFANIVADGKIRGRITLNTSQEGGKKFSPGTQKLLKSFASLASAFFSFQHYNLLQSQFTRELITAIIQILELYDNYTSGHSENVAGMGMDIAKLLGLPQKEVEVTYWAGMVHDIGKLLVPHEILNKKGPLTEEEYALMKKHSYWSYKALSSSPSLGNISRYVLHHHERWDGQGYPEGLKAEEIPLISRILSIVDAWDAMTSQRSYRAPLPVKKALKEIMDNKGTQFDPEVAEIFIDYIKDAGII